jgi:hypothetical protein
MIHINVRLNNFYTSLIETYPTIQIADIIADDDSLTFIIDYVDISQLSLIPIMKSARIQNLSINHLNVFIKEDKKYLIGTVQLKAISLAQDTDKASLQSE